MKKTNTSFHIITYTTEGGDPATFFTKHYDIYSSIFSLDLERESSVQKLLFINFNTKAIFSNYGITANIPSAATNRTTTLSRYYIEHTEDFRAKYTNGNPEKEYEIVTFQIDQLNNSSLKMTQLLT